MACNKYGKDNYQVEFQTPGYGAGRFRCSTGTSTKSIAEAYERHLLTIYREGKFDLLDRVKARTLSLPKLKEQMDAGGIKGVIAYVEEEDRKARESAAELHGQLDEFLADPAQRASEYTRSNYCTQIGWYIRFRDEQLNGAPLPEGVVRPGPARKRIAVTASHIDADSISTWLRAVENTPSVRYADKRTRKPKTVNHHRAAIMAFCSWLEKRGVIEENPCTDAYRAKEVTGDPVYLNRRQWPEFRAASLAYDAERVARWEVDPREDHTRAYPCTLFWDFLSATGATSYNEGCRVRTADVHLDENPGSEAVRVWLRGTKTVARARNVFISRALAERLKEFASLHGRGHFDPIFPWGKNEASHVWGEIKERLMEAGKTWIEPVRVYDLRHTYAVNMIVGDRERSIPGVDIVTLMNLMGHKRIETTMIYARHVGDHARDGCMVLHRVLGL